MAKTPRKQAIIAKAKELWFEDQYKNGSSELAQANPEYEELLEGGYVAAAQSMLMRDKYRAELENEYVDFPKDFTVDLTELFESNALILGSRHSGKSDAAMYIADKAMKQNAIVVCFDPSLDWIARSSIPTFTRVEPYASLDVPSESMIYDISLLSPRQQQKIVEAFSKRLFEHQAERSDRKQYLVVFEEAHTYFYQGSMRAKALQNTVRLLSVGRNVSVACLLITQFASMLDKFAVKHATSQAWFGFTKEPNDVRYLRMLLGENVEQVTKLQDGEFLYLTRNALSKIAIEPYESGIAKTEVKPSDPEPIPIPQKPYRKTQDTANALSCIFLLLIWCLILWIALIQRV